MDWYDAMLKEETGIAWKMVLKETGEKAGVISIYSYKPEHKKAEIGFWLLPEYWGKSYASEALHAAVDYWKREKGLHRLEAFVEEGNNASSKLLERCGFRYEGKMSDCEIKNGKYISLRIYASIFEEN
jgi:ribosomal-protein-alanine N-acetyltransferase